MAKFFTAIYNRFSGGRDAGGSSSGPGAGVDNILIETGDAILTETGDAILLESA